MNRISTKQAHFLEFLARHPGVATADIHRAVGRAYAHGAHQYTYSTVDRLMRRGLIERTGDRTATGGVGLRVTTAGLRAIGCEEAA